jgi:hypothetical protein
MFFRLCVRAPRMLIRWPIASCRYLPSMLSFTGAARQGKPDIIGRRPYRGCFAPPAPPWAGRKEEQKRIARASGGAGGAISLGIGGPLSRITLRAH